MLKMHQSLIGGTAAASCDLNQRRPSRITTACGGVQQPQQQQRPAQHPNGSRLRSSTIARVPLAKSRLRQPVAHAADLSASSSSAAAGSGGGGGSESKAAEISKQQLDLKSINRPASAKTANCAVGLGTRPTSLPLGNGVTRNLARSSLLPTKTTASSSSSSGNSSISQPNATLTNSTNRTKSRVVGTQPSSGAWCSQSGRKAAAAAKQATAAGSASDDTRGSSSSGGGSSSISKTEANAHSGLKNLVAVVHPQHSTQRVNSSATTTATTSTVVNKLSPTTSKPAITATTPETTLTKTTTTNSANSKLMSIVKLESGKVNSNHKDVNGRESGKQDGSRARSQQVLCGSQKTTATSSAVDQVGNVSTSTNGGGGGTVNSNNGTAKRGALRVATGSQNELPPERDSQSDQFLLCNGNNNYNNGGDGQTTLSVASSASDDSGDKQDYLQHERKSKQTRKRPSNRTPDCTTRPSTRKESDHQGTPAEGIVSGRSAGDNCYNHHRGAKSSLTKSSAGSDFNRPANGSPFNNRLLSKPMGQQVLSLMMLDVGLLPSDSHHSQQQQQQQQQHHQPLHKVSSVSHVRIQSPPECGVFDSNGCVINRSIFQNGFYNQLSNDAKNVGDDRENGTNIPINELLHLQLTSVNLDSQRIKSISLPSSPRLRIRESCHSQMMPQEMRQSEFSNRSRLVSPCRTANGNVFPSSGHLLSPNRLGNERRTAQTISSADRQDSHSVSSSCSSLNHNYPPLLAISNQLNDLNLHELMQRRGACPTQESKRSTPTPMMNGQPDHGTIPMACPTIETRAPRTQQQQQQQQQGSSPESGTHLSRDGNNCFNACPSPKARETFNRESSGNRALSEIQAAYDPRAAKNCLDGESCPDPSLRQRQQQQRSHSISGQELNFNGLGYQRLNQFVTQHVPPEVDHHRQRYGLPANAPIYQSNQQQQQQQQQQLQHQHLRAQLSGRSPSPLSYNGQHEQRDLPSKYQNEKTQPRNQLHASLECLNSGYLEYQQHQQQLRHHQQNLQNQHYAATNYVLATPPANTVINQSGDQDLAAAAMDNTAHHQQYQQTASPTPTSNYAHQNSMINRAVAQIHQSPARRFSSAQHGGAGGGGGMASTLINNLTNLHHPIRAGHSSLSLASSSYLIEDKLQNEIRKLHSELKSEKEKNEALNSQLNINSNLMAAFEQSLTTLNSRLRQLTTLSERKDQEIEELREQLRVTKISDENRLESSPNSDLQPMSPSCVRNPNELQKESPDEKGLMKVIEDLRRQLIEKDRLLTDTRLEALTAAHQLEQLESRLDRDHRSIVVNEDDLDEGVMVVNHSPSDSDAVTDSAHFSDINSQIGKSNQSYSNGEMLTIRSVDNCSKNVSDSSPENNNHTDDQSNHSSDYNSNEVRANDQTNLSESASQQFNESDTSPMDKLMDSLLSAS